MHLRLKYLYVFLFCPLVIIVLMLASLPYAIPIVKLLNCDFQPYIFKTSFARNSTTRNYECVRPGRKIFYIGPRILSLTSCNSHIHV